MNTVAQPDLLVAERGFGRSGALLCTPNTITAWASWDTPAVLMAGGARAYLENDQPARLLSAKLDQPDKIAATNREVAPFRRSVRLARL